MSRRETGRQETSRGTAQSTTRRPLRMVVSATGSLELTTIGLVWMFGLVLAGTFYQLGHSIQETTAVFFHSWFVLAGPVPLPSGQFVLAILGVNLVVSAFTRIPFRWDKIGLFVIHLGLILLVVGGMTQRLNRRESVLLLAEGESDSYSYDLQNWEVVVGESGDERYPVANLPAEISGLPVASDLYIPDSVLAWDGDDDVVNSEGATGLAPSTGGTGNPVPGVLFRLGTQKVLLHGADRAPTVTGSGVSLRLAPSRYVIPATIKLEEFTAEFFEGSDTPKSFTSRVLVTQGEVERTAVISMNQPLRLREYTIYQLAYDEGGTRDVSVFQVVRNPMRWIAYAVTLLISAGLFLHFGIRVVDLSRRRSL